MPPGDLGGPAGRPRAPEGERVGSRRRWKVGSRQREPQPAPSAGGAAKSGQPAAPSSLGRRLASTSAPHWGHRIPTWNLKMISETSEQRFRESAVLCDCHEATSTGHPPQSMVPEPRLLCPGERVACRRHCAERRAGTGEGGRPAPVPWWR